MPEVISQLPWSVILILLPLTAAIAGFFWPRCSRALGLLAVSGGIPAVAALGWQLWTSGVSRHAVGGWGAPLGIMLHADGLSLMMLAMTALVGFFVSLHAVSYFAPDRARWFWPIWMLLLAGLNALFLSSDIFNLYVTLELVGLAAVMLVALAGNKTALAGAMRYLLASLLSSNVYLLGVALLYHQTGSLDIRLLGEQAQPSPALWGALALMTVSMLLKTALFPLHFWLPPAHGSAPAPVSALLSALVVKSSLYLLARLWLEIFSPSVGAAVGNLLGVLGMAAVIWGSVQALRQSRLKLLVAYSTVAQLGYMFLAFPFSGVAAVASWGAVIYLLVCHALAKSALFLAVGNVQRFNGHDRIADLDRVVYHLPLTAYGFAVAGVTVMGLPPSGGFFAKWLLMQTALAQGRWDIALVLLVGGLLAAAYIFKVMGHTFTAAPRARKKSKQVSRSMEWAVMLLAISSISLGFLAVPFLTVTAIGEPFAGETFAGETVAGETVAIAIPEPLVRGGAP